MEGRRPPPRLPNADVSFHWKGGFLTLVDPPLGWTFKKPRGKLAILRTFRPLSPKTKATPPKKDHLFAGHPGKTAAPPPTLPFPPAFLPRPADLRSEDGEDLRGRGELLHLGGATAPRRLAWGRGGARRFSHPCHWLKCFFFFFWGGGFLTYIICIYAHMYAFPWLVIYLYIYIYIYMSHEGCCFCFLFSLVGFKRAWISGEDVGHIPNHKLPSFPCCHVTSDVLGGYWPSRVSGRPAMVLLE